MMVMAGMSDPTKQPPFKFLKDQAQRLQTEVVALVFAYRDRRTPWYAKAWTGLVLMYALSPIDLIPDFIPVLGYLDDLILIPAGIALALKMIPSVVMAEAREKAIRVANAGGGMGKWGALIIICLWLLVLALIGGLVHCLMKN
jgi:uncharacterized membrane protein YkvA (DUF1232 family)